MEAAYWNEPSFFEHLEKYGEGEQDVFIAEDGIEKRPNIRLSVLKDGEALEQFIAALGDFVRAVNYVLKKNAELYRRLA